MHDVNLRFQATDDGEPAEAPVRFKILELTGKHIVAHGDGDPEQVGAAEGHDAFEARRRHPNDGVRCAIQGDGLADELVIGTELARPQAVAQNHFRVAADFLVPVGNKGATAIGLDAEDIEEVTAHERGVQLLRLGLTAPIQRDGKGDGRQAGENVVLVAVVLVIGERSAGELEVGIGVERYGVAREKLRQTRRFLDRQRVEEDRVDNRENGGVGPDAQRQREHGHEGEAGALLEHAQAAPQVLLEVSSHNVTPA